MKLFKTISFAAVMAVVMCCAGQKSANIDGKWKIVEVAGNQISSEADFIKTPAVVLENGRYSVDAGANVINGCFKVKENKVSFGEGAMTKMMATPEVMEVEDAIVASLKKELTVSFEGDTLVLSADGLPVLKLVK